MPAQAHVEGGVARPEAGVAASANRPLVGGVIISVDLAARKQGEGVPAVVREDRSELEARDDRALPRAIKHPGDDPLMALIARREAAVQAQIGRVLRSVVTVEIRGGVETFAVGVIPQKREGIAEALLNFQDSPLVKRRRCSRVLVVLHNQRVHKTGERICARVAGGKDTLACVGAADNYLLATERVGRRCAGLLPRGRHTPIPVAVLDDLSIRERRSCERCLQEDSVYRRWEPERVRVYTAQRDGEAGSDFTFNAQRSLLRVGRLIVRRIAE